MLCVLWAVVGCLFGVFSGLVCFVIEPVLLLSLDMVDVVRVACHGVDVPFAWCRPLSDAGGDLFWAVLPVSLETLLLVSVSEFGDLGSYSSLSVASRVHRWHLAVSMHCLSVEVGRIDARASGACYVCGELGLARHFASECDNCTAVACEDCVALAVVCGKRVLDPPAPVGVRSWLCVWCVGSDDHADAPTVPSLKTSVVDGAWDIAHRVKLDYDFGFFLRLVTLSGEEVVDERGRRVGSVYTHWGMGFERVWRSVYHYTGGRVRQLVLGARMVDSDSLPGAKWSQFLSRSEARLCTRDSPYSLLVLLRGWW